MILKKLLFSLALLPLLMLGCSLDDFPILTGEYLGQASPCSEPKLFAPGIISTGMATRDVAMTPDGREFYFSVSIGRATYSSILWSRVVKGRWTQPEVAPFSQDPAYKNIEPCIAPDGQRFYFASNRPLPDRESEENDFNLWVMDRTVEGWGDPYPLGDEINTDKGEFFPSVTRDGTLYFTRDDMANRTNTIFRARLNDGVYTSPEKCEDAINSTRNQFNAFVAPDESYIIVPTFGRKDSHGSTDYYIAFRNSDGSWRGPYNMGPKVNSEGGREYSPYVSPDGRFFFFMASHVKAKAKFSNEKMTLRKIVKMYNEPQNGNSDIYWVDASFIEKLRLKHSE